LVALRDIIQVFADGSHAGASFDIDVDILLPDWYAGSRQGASGCHRKRARQVAIVEPDDQ
jgi:hypothetical protein